VSAGALTVLAGLPRVSPSRLRLLLLHHEPGDALDRLAAGRRLHPMVMRGVAPEALEAWRATARQTSADEARAGCERLGVRVIPLGDADYPNQLALDPEPPAVLFVQGDLASLDARRVGIVGTRNATAAGRATATELGSALGAGGVTIVSGLARGIDAAAHRGVRVGGAPGRAVAVVGNGLDLPYPKQNAELWGWVAEHGLLLSEWPPGVGPTGWRFPLRNRVIAALCEVLVVVESRERGGSLITAAAAADRGVEVMAVPGSPRSRASAGTNQLLVDGVAPVTSAADVFGMLGLDHRRQTELPFDPRPAPDALQRKVLDVCAEQPATIDLIAAGLDLGIAEAAMAAARLERTGWLVEAGGWFEPAGSRLRPT
jgi:DNA processing protein